MTGWEFIFLFRMKGSMRDGSIFYELGWRVLWGDGSLFYCSGNKPGLREDAPGEKSK